MEVRTSYYGDKEEYMKIVTATTSTPPLNESNYPDVCFWTQDKYKTWERLNSARLQGALCKCNDLMSLLWLEDQDRKMFSKDTTSAVLRKMHAVWQGFKQCGIAPPTWGTATDEVKKAFYSEVVATFPQLCLCANNWKAEAVVTSRYSSWAQMYLKDSKDPRKHQVKSEEGSSSVEPDAKHFKLDPTADGDAMLPASPKSDTNSAPVESSVAPPPLSKLSEPILKESQVETLLPEKLPMVKNPL